MIDLPVKFPREADKIFEEAEAFRRLSPSDRLLAILDLIASGLALLEHSPHREAGLRLKQAQKAEWRKAQKEFLTRHAR
jgi:hypothetical protein